MSSPKWTAAELPRLDGRTFLVTGANSGIGLVAARELGRAGARVVLAVRDPAKGEHAAETIPGEREVRQLDLAEPTTYPKREGTFPGRVFGRFTFRSTDSRGTASRGRPVDFGDRSADE